MSTEKGKNVILKLGARTIECGYEGSSKPLATFNVHHFSEFQNFQITNPTISGYDHSLSTAPKWDHTNQVISAIESDHLNFRHLFYPDLLIYPNQEILLNDLKIHLKSILKKIFYKCGMITINAKVMLLQNINFPKVYQKIITDILIQELFIRAVVILPTPLMISISSGSSFAIVIDIGWNLTSIIPVFDNRILQNYSMITTRAGSRLHYELLSMLKNEGLNISSISFRDLENAILDLELNNDDDNNDQLITVGPYLVKMESFINVINDVFMPDYIDSDNFENDEIVIPQLIRKLMDKLLPIDLKSSLASRVIITGRISNVPGFNELLLSKINNITSQRVSTIHSLGDWAGSSIYSTIMKNQKKSHDLLEVRK